MLTVDGTEVFRDAITRIQALEEQINAYEAVLRQYARLANWGHLENSSVATHWEGSETLEDGYEPAYHVLAMYGKKG